MFAVLTWSKFIFDRFRSCVPWSFTLLQTLRTTAKRKTSNLIFFSSLAPIPFLQLINLELFVNLCVAHRICRKYLFTKTLNLFMFVAVTFQVSLPCNSDICTLRLRRNIFWIYWKVWEPPQVYEHSKSLTNFFILESTSLSAPPFGLTRNSRFIYFIKSGVVDEHAVC